MLIAFYDLANKPKKLQSNLNKTDNKMDNNFERVYLNKDITN